jgi:hypothetical protein
MTTSTYTGDSPGAAGSLDPVRLDKPRSTD